LVFFFFLLLFFAYQEDNGMCACGKQIGGQLARKKCFDV